MELGIQGRTAAVAAGTAGLGLGTAKALAAEGRRTVFNILGPLINPGRPAHVLLGSFSAACVPRLAEALAVLGVKAGIAVHGVIAPGKGID